MNETELAKIDHDVSRRALYDPGPAVVSPRLILHKLSEELANKGTKIVIGSSVLKIDMSNSVLHTQHDIGLQYAAPPVKGNYKLLKKDLGIRCNGLVYPAPDLNMPFLGVHFTKTTEGEVYPLACH